MSQPSRPSPVQPPFVSNEPTTNMAQTQRHPTFPTTSFLGRPEQRSSGPQLPPIHQPNRPTPEEAGRPLKLPPMQVPSPGSSSPSRSATGTRSMAVADLLSSGPPSPPRSHAAPAQQSAYYRHSPTSSYGNSPVDFRAQHPPFPHAPPPHLNQVPMAYRQPPPPLMYQQGHPQQPHYAPVYPPLGVDQGSQRQFSPAVSGFSSPTNYTHSESSPRSSLGPSSVGAAYSSKPRMSKPPPLNFTLSIRQQPAAARACGFGERDRRVIDPPPILELKITDRNGLPEQDPSGMLALHCALLSPDGAEDETELPPAHPDMPSTRRLMGSLCASPYQAKDENGQAGTFFVFPDLSCRSPGRYRLKFKLLRVDLASMVPGAASPYVASIVTDIFSVYTAKDFPGMRASSALLKALRRQGLNVGVKKGSEARKGKGKAKKEIESGSGGSSSEGEGDSDGSESDERTTSGGVSPKTKSRKKGKRRRRDE